MGISKTIQRRRSQSFPKPPPTWLISCRGTEPRSTLLVRTVNISCLCKHLRNPLSHQREGERSEFKVWVKLGRLRTNELGLSGHPAWVQIPAPRGPAVQSQVIIALCSSFLHWSLGTVKHLPQGCCEDWISNTWRSLRTVPGTLRVLTITAPGVRLCSSSGFISRPTSEALRILAHCS